MNIFHCDGPAEPDHPAKCQLIGRVGRDLGRDERISGAIAELMAFFTVGGIGIGIGGQNQASQSGGQKSVAGKTCA